MNEFSLINNIRKMFLKRNKNTLVGIGDDCAVIKTTGKKLLLATTDSLVENVHFKKPLSAFKLGQRSVIVNISDIAAMGGISTHILVSLILPKNTQSKFIDEFYKGTKVECEKYNIDVVGGNISAGKDLSINIFLLGEVEKNKMILRNGGKPGDIVLVTGTLGNAPIIPPVRLRESQILSSSQKVTSMIDISDGLSSDIAHICKASKVGVKLYAESIPRLQGVPLQNALNRGEDYELCFTALPKDAEFIKKTVENKTKTPVTIIGEITKSKKMVLLLNDKEIKLEKKGWNHFQ